MSSFVALAVVFSAALHAAWNALLRGSSDRRKATGWIGAASFLLCAPFLPFVGFPTGAWPYILVSSVIHIVYLRLLASAYDKSELSFAYPIARGSSPLLVALGGAITASERLSLSSVAGIVLISGGILMIGLDAKHWSRHALFSALSVGAVIAAYTVVDGLGARRCDSSAQYNVWCFSIYGAIVATQIRAGPKPFEEVRANLPALLSGAASVVAYSIVTWAMVHASMGLVSALRETSSLFAAVIGVIWLGERATPLRIAGCVGIVLGAACFAVR
ncbi:EamA family transporter [bacterium]|nr:MAG: EamA family transporter [bacterium]